MYCVQDVALSKWKNNGYHYVPVIISASSEYTSINSLLMLSLCLPFTSLTNLFFGNNVLDKVKTLNSCHFCILWKVCSKSFVIYSQLELNEIMKVDMFLMTMIEWHIRIPSEGSVSFTTPLWLILFLLSLNNSLGSLDVILFRLGQIYYYSLKLWTRVNLLLSDKEYLLNHS